MPLDTMTRMKGQASNFWAIQFQYNGLFITLLWVFPNFLPHLLATSQAPHCSSERVLPSSIPTVPRAPAVPRARVGRARGQAAKWEVRCPSGGTKNHKDVQYILCMYLYIYIHRQLLLDVIVYLLVRLISPSWIFNGSNLCAERRR